jgi:hypothetical protein
MEASPTIEISAPIDFTSIGLYVLALQLVGVTLLLTTITVTLPYMVPRTAASSVRTVACLCIVGIMCLRYPLRVGRTRGLVLVFHALRPGAAIYITALVMEHLSFSDSENNFMGGMRSVGYHTLTLVLIACGMVRAVTVSPNKDAPFAIAILAAAFIAFLPPESTSEVSPLVGRPGGIAVADRYLRAVTFVLLYSSHAYSLAPTSHLSEEVGLTVARSVAASAWTLGCHPALLPITIIQFGLVIANRLNVRHVEPIEMYDKVETRSNASVLSDADTGVAAETARFLASLPGGTVGGMDGVGGMLSGSTGQPVGADEPTDIELAALEVARDNTEGVPIDVKTLALVSRQAQQKKRGLGVTGCLLPR